MILSESGIRAAIDSGALKFDPPLEPDQIGPASIDLRLGFSITKLKDLGKDIKISAAGGLGTIAKAGLWEAKTLKAKDEFGKPEVFCLEPKEFILAMTYEKISIPDNLIGMVEGRSTYARLGISMHQTAPWIQPGWSNGAIVLEIMNHGSFCVELKPVTDRPCQLTLFQLSDPVPNNKLYGQRPDDNYQGQVSPFPNKD